MAKILIVDDRPINRKFLVALLGHYGHELTEASNGLEALNSFRTIHPDLIILDIFMPEMNGFEFVNVVRGEGHDVPTIFYTSAFNEREAVALAESCGVTEIITKPSDPSTILQRVNSILSSCGIAPPVVDGGQTDTAPQNEIPEELLALQSTGIRLTALIELGIELASEMPREVKLQRFCLAARKIIASQFAALGIPADDGDGFHEFFVSGGGLVRNHPPAPPRPHQGILDVLLSGSRPVRLSNTGLDPQVQGLTFNGSVVTSFLGVPIFTPKRTYGWLYLVNKEGADEFSMDDESLAVTLAAQVGIAYENTLLAEEVIRNAEELDRTRLQQIEMKNQFLSHVSHELRTPLSTIHQFTTILLDGIAGELNEDQTEYLKIMLRNSKHLRSMIGDLLDATRSETGNFQLEPRRVALVDVASELLKSYQPAAGKKHICLYSEIASDLPDLFADEGRLKQILGNLVDNALKFTPDHGTVCIRARMSEDDGEQLEVSVEDTGCGISESANEKIFERFHQERGANQTSRRGLGLGLHICKQLVERQGGNIWVESCKGEGSKFSFTLPAYSNSPVPPFAADKSGGSTGDRELAGRL